MNTGHEDDLGHVFFALSDATRRSVLATLVKDGSASVPSLTATLPISRQAIAKHLATLEDAGLLERARPHGREVRYGLRAQALTPALDWLAETDAAWGARLERLKRAVEQSVQ